MTGMKWLHNLGQKETSHPPHPQEMPVQPLFILDCILIAWPINLRPLASTLGVSRQRNKLVAGLHQHR